jgi:hypothetical protein
MRVAEVVVRVRAAASSAGRRPGAPCNVRGTKLLREHDALPCRSDVAINSRARDKNFLPPK